MIIKETLTKKKLFVFDMDGTIYLGGKVFDFAVRFIHNLRNQRIQNSVLYQQCFSFARFLLKKLASMDFSPKRNEILTSGDVTIEFLKKHRAGKSVYLVGTPELCEQFKQSGITLSDDAELVVTSFDTTLTYKKLDTACRLIRSGAEYLSTHPDFNCPTGERFYARQRSNCRFCYRRNGSYSRIFRKTL